MHRCGATRCRHGCCRRLGALRRAALLLAAVLFAASAILHAAGGSHAEAAAAHSHGAVHAGHGHTQGAACSETALGEAIDAVCASGGICGLCVPVTAPAALSGPPKPLAVAGLLPALGDRAASCHFRPPRLSATS